MTLSHLSALTCGQVSEVSSHGEASAPHFTPKIEAAMRPAMASNRINYAAYDSRSPGLVSNQDGFADIGPIKISGKAMESQAKQKDKSKKIFV